MPVRVLFLAANPMDTDRLRLDEEVRTIDHRLREGDVGRDIELESFWAVRASDLSEALLRTSPHIVHFSGHGTVDGIVLEGRDGKAAVVPRDALAELFGVLSDDIECVVFNACFAEGQARAVAEHIPAVVGTTTAITDEGALTFAAGFYRGIAYGRTIQDAFRLGRNEVALLGLPDEGTFELIGEAGIAVEPSPRPGQTDAPLLAGATRSASVLDAPPTTAPDPPADEDVPPPPPPAPRRRWLPFAGFAAAAVVGVIALVFAFYPGGPGNEFIEDEIEDRLDDPHKGLPLFRDVDVEVTDGEVELSGFVDTETDIGELTIVVQGVLDDEGAGHNQDPGDVAFYDDRIVIALGNSYPDLSIASDTATASALMRLKGRVSTDDEREKMKIAAEDAATALDDSRTARPIDASEVITAENEARLAIGAVLTHLSFNIEGNDRDGYHVDVGAQALLPLKRDVMAAIFYEMRGLGESGDEFPDAFVDDGDSEYELQINALAAAGITKGCNPPENDQYCPDRLVTRAEMSTFLVRAFQYTDDGGGNLFVDDDDTVHEENNDKIATAGVLPGCEPENRKFCPDTILTREQMANALARALEII